MDGIWKQRQGFCAGANNIYVKMPTYLDKIISDHREMARSDQRRTSDLLSMALERDPCRGFRGALAGDGVSVIVEIKRKSPSKGDLNIRLEPANLARSYELNGASCISILTDEKYFSGSLSDLVMVRKSVNIPILRKDFTVCSNDVLDARLHGADAVLLIVSALSQQELADLHGFALEVGMDVLVEVHDEAELERARAVGADLVGVNQRNLSTFEVDPGKAVSMAKLFDASVVKVCESGISKPSQMLELARAGYEAVLVGETLVKSSDPGKTLQELLSAGRGGF